MVWVKGTWKMSLVLQQEFQVEVQLIGIRDMDRVFAGMGCWYLVG